MYSKIRAKIVWISAVIVVCAGAVYLHYRAEEYRIVSAFYFPTNSQALLQERGKLFYSSEELIKDNKIRNLAESVGISASELQDPKLILVSIPNFVVKRAVGRGGFGFVMVSKNVTNGISLTMLRGTKRFLQFNSADAQPELMRLDTN